MKYNAVLIDDELKLQEVLKIKLTRFCPQINIVGTASDINQGESIIREHKPDIVFLDIAMPSGSGFDLLKRFDTIHFEVIFVTGYGEYAIQALRLSAADYLLKPLQTKELQTAVDSAIVRIDKRGKSERFDALKQNLASPQGQHQKVVIPSDDNYQFVNLAEIIRCEGWERYTRVHIETGTVIVSSYNIGVFREMLEPFGFYLCHKSHLINEKAISQYLKEGIVIMIDGSKVPISRRKREEFSERYLRGHLK